MIKKIIRKLKNKHTATSEDYVAYLRKLGMQIGEDVTFYSPQKTLVDKQYPWQITIGDHVRITQGVIILTHDYSWSVLKSFESPDGSGAILGASGNVVIGNNVFIGMNTIILRNVTIGDNVIIGAGSVVSKNCESGWVYAGNPAKKIITVEEYYNKRKAKQLDEAKELYLSYWRRFGRKPEKEVFHECFMLFCNENSLNDVFLNKMKLCGNEKDSFTYLKNNHPVFNSFEEFSDYCMDSLNKK